MARQRGQRDGGSLKVSLSKAITESQKGLVERSCTARPQSQFTYLRVTVRPEKTSTPGQTGIGIRQSPAQPVQDVSLKIVHLGDLSLIAAVPPTDVNGLQGLEFAQEPVDAICHLSLAATLFE